MVDRHRGERFKLPTEVEALAVVGAALMAAEAQLRLNVLPPLLCLMVVLIAFRQIPFAFILYTLGLCCLSISSPILSKDELIDSTGLFLTVAIPVFLILARWISRWLVVVQTRVSAGLLVQAVLLMGSFAGRRLPILFEDRVAARSDVSAGEIHKALSDRGSAAVAPTWPVRTDAGAP